jgi:AraC-like DNA-binding protein
MNESGITMESRRAEQSKITANFIMRMRECLGDSDQQQYLTDALLTAGITERDIAERRNIEQQQLDRALQLVLRKVPDISLRMFSRAELSDLGVMGYAAINSDTVGRAMRFLIRYHELTSDRYVDALTVHGDVARVTPLPRMAHMHSFTNIAEDSLAGNWRTLGLLIGDDLDPAKASVNFVFQAPDYEATFHEVFDCPVHFNAERNELAFPVTWLQRPIASGNQTMADVCTAMCERLLGAGEASRSTEQVVRRLLLSRPGRRMYRLEEAAAELNLSTAQLRKRLYRAGTSYKKLVLEIRMALARHYLEDTNLAIQEIAYLLDYSQAAPFSRAFKSYYGQSPEQDRDTGAEVGAKM